MSKSLILLLALALQVCLAHCDTSWKSCGAGAFQLKGAALEPERITPGTTARFTVDIVSGADEDVEGGNIVMLVRMAGLPIYTQQDELCSKTTCPIKNGAEAKLVYEQDFPEFTPPASYSLTLSGKSSSGADLFCIEIAFSVLPPSGEDILSTS